MTKDHGLQTYHLWSEIEDGAQESVLLIDGDPPSRYLMKNPKILHSFQASSYREARIMLHQWLGWDPPSPDEPDFDYPPEELLK